MARQKTSVLILSGIWLLTTTQNALALTNDQRLLAKCEAVYAYSAHLAQIQNNIGFPIFKR